MNLYLTTLRSVKLCKPIYGLCALSWLMLLSPVTFDCEESLSLCDDGWFGHKVKFSRKAGIRL